ncbi:Quinolinate synthetase [hydrothermal vent metagenome]|uniref:quinolinate synthase n=1 Tax=hydrothermal vent metagenome TaxID=652676 RepID=A0A1W1CKZ5_9ZZZZ
MLTAKIKKLLIEKNTVLVAHYYVDGALQDLAESTGGFVGDSLEMARFGKNTNAKNIIVAGVRFMGETAKILSPEKNVFILDKNATCSLDENCPIDSFTKFCDEHLNREVVVYANTSAEVKAKADWMVTSSSALSVINHLNQQGKKILWAPDKHLGHYIQSQTNADMLLWEGSCVVHENFKAEGILKLKKQYPNACVLVHPESPKEVIKIADVVGSTTALINAVKSISKNIFIVATDNGIFHKMKEVNPTAKFIEAPTMGVASDCESCAHCEWMAMNTLEKLLEVLENNQNEILLENSIISQAQNSINKLLNFTKKD